MTIFSCILLYILNVFFALLILNNLIECLYGKSPIQQQRKQRSCVNRGHDFIHQKQQNFAYFIYYFPAVLLDKVR